MPLTEEHRREALDAAIVAFEEMGGGVALRAELDAFYNLRLSVYTKVPSASAKILQPVECDDRRRSDCVWGVP